LRINLSTVRQVLFHVETGKKVIFDNDEMFGFLELSEGEYAYKLVMQHNKGGRAHEYTNNYCEEGKSKTENIVEHCMNMGIKFYIDDSVTITRVKK